MIPEIIKELTAIKNTSMVTSEQILTWARRVEAKRLKESYATHLTKDKSV